MSSERRRRCCRRRTAGLGRPERLRQPRRGRSSAEAAGLPGRGLVTPLLRRVLGLAWSGLGDRKAALDDLRTSISEARGRSATYELALSLRALAELSLDPEPEVEAEAAALAARPGLVAGAAAGRAAYGPPAQDRDLLGPAPVTRRAGRPRWPRP